MNHRLNIYNLKSLVYVYEMIFDVFNEYNFLRGKNDTSFMIRFNDSSIIRCVNYPRLGFLEFCMYISQMDINDCRKTMKRLRSVSVRIIIRLFCIIELMYADF